MFLRRSRKENNAKKMEEDIPEWFNLAEQRWFNLSERYRTSLNQFAKVLEAGHFANRM